MPTYEYECLKCQHRFEKFQGIKDKPLEVCPRCGGKLKRLIGTGVGIIFKGKGFYHTDYKKTSGGEGIKDKGKGVNGKPEDKGSN
jgi:putative FmdB family regulatory protein